MTPEKFAIEMKRLFDLFLSNLKWSVRFFFLELLPMILPFIFMLLLAFIVVWMVK